MRRHGIIPVFLLLTGLAIACTQSTPAPDQNKVTLNINLGAEPQTADPALSADGISLTFIEEMFQGLTDLDEETMEAVPELATEWWANADNTVWTFKMRDDVVWVRYNPGTGQVEKVVDDTGGVRIVDAHDVVYGVKRTCDPRTGSDYAYILYIIAGCQALNTAAPDAGDLQALYDAVGVRAVDDFTVAFTLTYGASFFPQIASIWVAHPTPRWLIEAEGERWSEPGVIHTNGPYVMTEWLHEDHLVLEKNPLWYGWRELTDQAGNIERIVAVMISEASTELALYETNALDTSGSPGRGVPQDQIERVKADPQLSQELVIQPANCTEYYGFITQKPPTADVRVRKALSMAIDRQTLVATVTKGGEIPANTFTNPQNFGSPAGDIDIAPWALPEDMGGWGYDRAVAGGKQLLEEAGYPDGAGLDILLMYPTTEKHARVAQTIQGMWMSAYPQMEVTLESQEWRVYLKTIDRESPLEEKPNAYRLGWCADYPHANNWVHEVLHPTEGANRPLISPDDPQVGDAVARFAGLTKQAQIEPEPARQMELYKEAERLYVDEIVGIAPIYYYTRVSLAKPWLDRVWGDLLRLHIWKWKIDWEAKQAAMGK